MHDTTKTPTLIIIGGGITGAGIARDAALRGFRVTLVEQNEMGSGTSGHFHGILHSGARYAINHPDVAAECYQENQIIRRIAPSTITDTGGLFLALNDQEAAHADTVIAACQQAGIPVTEVSVSDLVRQEPQVSSSVIRAFAVPDAFINGGELIRLNIEAATSAAIPATILTHHMITGLQKDGTRVISVTAQDSRSGHTVDIPCDYVINACGVWSGTIARMIGIDMPMLYDKGTMIAFTQQYSRAVLNRCRSESDGDLLVPGGTHSIMGTTARPLGDLVDVKPSQEEIDLLLREGAQMVPALQSAAISSIYAGVRPLLDDGRLMTIPGVTTRTISRSFHVIDHTADKTDNFITVVGGKVTIYRRMAEVAVDLLCQKDNRSAVCQTANISL